MSALNTTNMSDSGSTQWAAEGILNSLNDDIVENTNVVADVPVGTEASQGAGGAGSIPRAAEESQHDHGSAPAPPPKWGTGYLVALMLKVFAILFLGIRVAIIVAPAVRVGLSWARLNLHRVDDLAMIGCIVGWIV